MRVLGTVGPVTCSNLITSNSDVRMRSPSEISLSSPKQNMASMHVGLISVNLQCLAYLIASASDQVKQHVADMNSMFAVFVC